MLYGEGKLDMILFFVDRPVFLRNVRKDLLQDVVPKRPKTITGLF